MGDNKHTKYLIENSNNTVLEQHFFLIEYNLVYISISLGAICTIIVADDSHSDEICFILLGFASTRQ